MIQVENSGPLVEKRKTSRAFSSSSRLRNWKVPEMYGQFSHRIMLSSEQCREWAGRLEASTRQGKLFCSLSVLEGSRIGKFSSSIILAFQYY